MQIARTFLAISSGISLIASSVMPEASTSTYAMPRKSPQRWQASSFSRSFWSIRVWRRSSGFSTFSASAESFGPKSKPGRARRSARNSLFFGLWGTAGLVLLEEPAYRVLVELLHRKQAGGPVQLHVPEQFGKGVPDLGQRHARIHLVVREQLVGILHGGADCAGSPPKQPSTILLRGSSMSSGGLSLRRYATAPRCRHSSTV